MIDTDKCRKAGAIISGRCRNGPWLFHDNKTSNSALVIADIARDDLAAVIGGSNFGADRGIKISGIKSLGCGCSRRGLDKFSARIFARNKGAAL